MIFLIVLSALICAIVFINNKEISIREYFIWQSTMIILVLLPYLIWIIPIQNDVYYESGRIMETKFHPYFVERYTQSHTICTSTGKSTSCTTYYTTEHAKYPEHWTVTDSLNHTFKVSKQFHDQVKNSFGNRKITTKPKKCKHGGTIVKGDPNVYVYKNDTNTYDFPTNQLATWHNKLKISNTIFNNKSSININYPTTRTNINTYRLIVPGEGLTQKDWDILNTKIYEKVGANVILVKIQNTDEAKQLEDKWLNGKKNDIVICIKGKYRNPDFVKVFGWTETAYVKVKLENSILEQGVDLHNIETIIAEYYKPYDVTKFNYISTPPPLYIFLISLVLAIIVGIIMYREITTNWETK